MTNALKQKIVHESEAQRQHVRLPFPVRAEINGTIYATKNMSPGGVSVENITGDFSAGKKIPVTLKIPFDNFSIDVNVEAEVLHYDAQQKNLGCRFVNLNANHISLFNHILRAFMVGDAVASNDVINIVTRDNFVKMRKTADANAPTKIEKKQIAGLAAATLLGLAALGFILGNVYESAFVIRATDATITAPTVELRAQAGGTINFRLEADTTLVEPGQVIATLTPAQSAGFGPAASSNIVSPCDCYIVGASAAQGQYVNAGQPVIMLIPADTAPYVIAELDPVKAGKIAPGAKARINVPGNKVEFSGRVTDIKSGMNSADISAPGYAPRPIQVRIAPDQKIPAGLAGRPVRVTFTTR